MSGQENRRISERKQCEQWTIKVYLLENQSKPFIDATVENLSDGGMGLISTTPFELDQEIFFKEPQLPGKGKIVWTCQSKSESKAGVLFL